MTIQKKQTHRDFSLEVKELTEEGKFSGYGAVFGNIDDWDDVILRGAFSKSISEKKPIMLWQHDSTEPIGIYESLREDEIGLWIEGRLLLDLEKGREAYILLKNQAIRGLSIGFIPSAWEWETRDNRRIRVLKEIDLWEISLVTFPANPKALIDDVKSIRTIRDVEDTLRDAGFSRTEAKALISACKSAQREAEDENEEIKAAQRLLNLMKGK